MKSIPTAEAFLEDHYKKIREHFLTFHNGNYGTYEEYKKSNPLKTLQECMIEFAKLHAQAALQAAFHKIKSDALETCGSDIPDCWDDLSILNAYPLENIE